jgi:hypothetical protein
MDIARSLIEFPCPSCSYEIEIQMLDAATQVWRWCPCCRVRIHIVEPDGTLSSGAQDMNRAIRDLGKPLRSFGL